jgi:hypothetical protein
MLTQSLRSMMTTIRFRLNWTDNESHLNGTYALCSGMRRAMFQSARRQLMGQLGNGVWTVFVTERKLLPTRFVLSICSCVVRLKELAEQARLKYRDAMNTKTGVGRVRVTIC